MQSISLQQPYEELTDLECLLNDAPRRMELAQEYDPSESLDTDIFPDVDVLPFDKLKNAHKGIVVAVNVSLLCTWRTTASTAPPVTVSRISTPDCTMRPKTTRR